MITDKSSRGAGDFISSEIISLTRGPYHHFFGFHDLLISNSQGNRLLALEVPSIDHAPLAGERASVGFVERCTGEFVRLGETAAWNYPQGARQQWIGNTNSFVVNDRVGDGWGSRIYDTDALKPIGEFPQPVHTLCSRSGLAFSMNYSRLYRLGAYGYIGLPDVYATEAAPSRDGIFRLNINTAESRLLVSLRDIVHCNFEGTIDEERHHYVTHLVLNPSGTRLAFLHRYRLPDGGEMTRLMTVDVEGRSLRCLLRGFLSHFDWKDDETLFIWGRANQSVANLRGGRIVRNPLVSSVLRFAKAPLVRILGKSSLLSMSFLLVSDKEVPTVIPVARNILTEDGHPMFCPLDRDCIVADTYPDGEGYRTLMLYRFSVDHRVDIGRFKMLNSAPDLRAIEMAMYDIDPIVRKDLPKEQFGFTRSGLHCDLHPRWLADGHTVAFDSIHEGSRQIYLAEVERVMETSRFNPSSTEVNPR